MANTPEDPNEWVRAEDLDTGHQVSILRRSADSAAWKILAGESAVDEGGTPLPPVHAASKAAKSKPASGN